MEDDIRDAFRRRRSFFLAVISFNFIGDGIGKALASK